jgi:hypothetical protein
MAALTVGLLGGAMAVSAPASAQVHIGVGIGGPDVHVGVGIGGPAPAYYYGPGYYPPGPCDGYTSYYAGDCGYSVYEGPIVLGGISVGGPHYYRWYDGRPYFWYRGGWQVWNGWDRSHFAWNRGEGFGWRNGHWDRGWGNAHWRGAERRDFREDRRDFRQDRRDFREERREDRRDFREDRRDDRRDFREHHDHH